MSLYNVNRERADEVADEHLGAVAVALLADPETQALGEGLAQATLHYEVGSDPDPGRNVDCAAYISVPPTHYKLFTDSDEGPGSGWGYVDPVYSALRSIAESDGFTVHSLGYTPARPPRDWRAQILAALESGGPTNQAVVAQLPDVFPKLDRMRFRDTAELDLYKAFRRRQETEKPARLLVAPNAAIRVTGRTWEADFLVAYRGRAGVLEVDGATHRNRRAADATKDAILRDHGITYVERVVAEDVKDDLAADVIVENFLRRMSE